MVGFKCVFSLSPKQTKMSHDRMCTEHLLSLSCSSKAKERTKCVKEGTGRRDSDIQVISAEI
jgi:hypothetical protein